MGEVRPQLVISVFPVNTMLHRWIVCVCEHINDEAGTCVAAYPKSALGSAHWLQYPENDRTKDFIA
jgi:hypothetical protein